jgi:hypothetical protein
MIVHLTPRKGKQNCVSDVSVFEERGGGDFKINAADIFFFDPIPTRAKKPGPLLLVYFMACGLYIQIYKP